MLRCTELPHPLQSDVMACKSPLTVIDAVLLPFDPAALPSEDWLQPAKAVGVEGCFVAPNGLITGDVLRDGRANPQAGWLAGWGQRRGCALSSDAGVRSFSKTEC